MGALGGLRRRPVPLAIAISALLSGIYLLWRPRTLDLAAQVFRADLWEEHGWVLWNDAWYSGHTVPGYGVLYPPLGALLGPELLGALCAVAAAGLFAAIAQRAYGERAWLGAAWFGAASTVALFGGRTTFALGLAFGLAAVWALQRGRVSVGALAGLGAGLASPIAGLFTALAAGAVVVAGLGRGARGGCNEGKERGAPEPAVGGKANSRFANSPAGRGRAALGVLIAASISTLLPSLLFPTDGYQPFVAGAFVPVAAAAAAALLLLPRDERVLRIGVVLYALLALASFLIHTPLGGNVVRLGATFAGPVLALVLLRGRRPLALALLALPLLWWQWTATVRDVAAGAADPSTEPAYYAPLLAELDARVGSEPVRVHVPPTRNRWEAVHVAAAYPLARGWLRQLETDDIGEFAGDGLTESGYARWLYSRRVGFVALADAEPDYLAEDEVDLLEGGGLDYLREVWSNDDWRLFEVRFADGTRPPTPSLAAGAAEVITLGPDGFTVRVPRAGEYLLALRFSPYFDVASGDACLASAGGVSTRLTARGEGPQTITVEARLSLGGLLRRDRVCSG